MPLEDAAVNRFVSRIRNDEPSDLWFEDIQEKVPHFLFLFLATFFQIVDVLRSDDHFYPGFKKSPLYLKMLEELGIIGMEDERSETPNSEISSISAISDSAMKVPELSVSPAYF